MISSIVAIQENAVFVRVAVKKRPHSTYENCKKNDPIHSLRGYFTILTQTMQIKFIRTYKKTLSISHGECLIQPNQKCIVRPTPMPFSRLP